MASLGRSLKPPSYLSSMTVRRPGISRSLSNMSNTSEFSSTASSPCEDFNLEDIAYSAQPSPTLSSSSKPSLIPRPSEMHLKLPDSGKASPLSQARPIAIELPPPKKSTASSSSVYTPPAPLSARGDVPGGYFPLHEEQDRVYRSHPFYLDASKARQKSIQRASHSSSPDFLPPVSAPTFASQPPMMAKAAPLAASIAGQPPAPPPTADTITANMPVASYIPSGVHASPLPMGKYYPSNYERRNQDSRPSYPGSAIMSTKSDTQVPTYRPDGGSRNESEAKRRLQQYQRDMIAQATLALNGGAVNTAALSAISLRSMGFTSLPSNPNKPKLEPLGSPGPVTPMDLESGDDGYLGVRIRNSGNISPAQDMARAIKLDEHRHRREEGSPVISPIF